MEKKFLLALSKIAGVICLITSLFLFVFSFNRAKLGILLWTKYDISLYKEALLVAIIMFLLAALLGIMGLVLFKYKETEEWIYNKKMQKAAKYEKKKQIQNETEETKKAMMEKYNDETWQGYIQDIELHRCMGVGLKWNILRVVSLILIFGSFMAIPVYAQYIDALRDYKGVIGWGMIVAFWAGIFGYATSNFHRTAEKNTIFITTNERLLYKIDLTDLHDREIRIPASKIQQLIFFHNKSEAIKEMEYKIDELIQSDEIKGELEGVINHKTEGKSPLTGMIHKLNSPILEKKIFGTRIKYWDETKGKWDRVDLPKKTQGYAEICKLINTRNVSIR